jgi:hypothetical protein
MPLMNFPEQSDSSRADAIGTHSESTAGLVLELKAEFGIFVLPDEHIPAVL